MKKLVLLMCLLSFAVPVPAEEALPNAEAVQYMNQSQGYSGFNRSLPKGEHEVFKKPTKVTKEKTYDYYGFEEDNEIKTPVKKVIKTRSESDSNAPASTKSTPMTYDNFPKFYDSSNMMMQGGMQGLMPGMF